MKYKPLIISILIGMSFALPANADEGMWIPMLIEKYNIGLMQEKGFKLDASDIYSVNKSCMKDAVMSFGGGCTAEIISPEGLLITNHHCGYGHIQALSSLEHDYLTNGYWAMSRDEELPCPGLYVTFLKRMEDVTEKVLTGIGDNVDEKERNIKITKNSEKIISEAVEGTHYSADVKPFYMGNQYFLLVYETFTDIRFVGAPPSAIGKFGGETDNWIWPRHTGDFSLFRIYADKDNKPAAYSADNVPFKASYHFPISLRGMKEGDFTMVFGFPGTTGEYVPSYHIDMIKNEINPKMIELREAKLDIIDKAMASDPLIRLQYASKKASVANAWKKWIGENQGLERMKTIEKKQAFEKQLTQWINADAERQKRYGDILPSYKKLYDKYSEYMLVNKYTKDAFFSNGVEAVGFAGNIDRLVRLVENNADKEEIIGAKEEILKHADRFFKNYDKATDKKLFNTIVKCYDENIDDKWKSPYFKNIMLSNKGNIEQISDDIYDKTVFSDKDKFVSFINGFDAKSIRQLNNDQIYMLYKGIMDIVSTKISAELSVLNTEIQHLNRLYMKAQMEYDSLKLFYPDANSTLRLSFGEVKGYDAEDAVCFRHYTTLKGIIEKDNPDIYDYDVPDKLKQLYADKDYGRYTQDGEIPVCFVATNHTTGGNSGSPVINGDGHLIGINFDRAWEGVASDMAFSPEKSRNISLDIRYALFLIDKFAGAGYLLDEMTLIE